MKAKSSVELPFLHTVEHNQFIRIAKAADLCSLWVTGVFIEVKYYYLVSTFPLALR